MITPEQLAKSNSEHGHQAALFCWANSSGIEELKWLFAIPNGFYASAKSKAAMKAEGLRNGVADIMLPVPSTADPMRNYNGLFIEMKQERYRRVGGLSEEQAEFAAFVTSQGYRFVISYSWIEAKDEILRYLGKA